MRISTLAIKCISLAVILFVPQVGQAGWVVDFGHKKTQMAPTPQEEMTMPLESSRSGREEKGMFEKIFSPGAPTQDIVIINTETGFIPNTVRVKEGSQYRLIVVNVNEKARNVSFVLDAFSEHHATFYGQVKSFYIQPKKEGVYTFVSPETSAQGRLIVHPSNSTNNPILDSPSVRLPASE